MVKWEGYIPLRGGQRRSLARSQPLSDATVSSFPPYSLSTSYHPTAKAQDPVEFSRSLLLLFEKKIDSLHLPYNSDTKSLFYISASLIANLEDQLAR